MQTRVVADEVIDAHGGTEHWRSATSMVVRFSSGGLAFGSKFQPFTLLDTTATIAVRGQHIELRGERPRPWAFAFPPASFEVRQRMFWRRADVARFAAAAM